MEVRHERRLGNITTNRQRFEADKAADWLDAIKRQVCPFCGEGPFVVVATHVSKKHGIDKSELREMLGVGYMDSICDPTHSALMRSAMQARVAAGEASPPARPQPGTKRRVSRKLHDSLISRVSTEQRLIGLERGRATQTALRIRSGELLRARFEGGEPIEALAAERGVTVRHMRQRLREAGTSFDQVRA